MSKISGGVAWQRIVEMGKERNRIRDVYYIKWIHKNSI